ncbi:MAG: diaminobutyrate acetyltransferase [Micromonosporaceae bacterium]
MPAPDPSHTEGPTQTSETPAYEAPKPEDGAELWRMARDSGTLDLNSPYMYLLGASHFAETSLIARLAGSPAGFVFGYLRPDAPDTLFVWQVAVAPAYRGRRLGHGMLAALVQRLRPRYLEASVTPDNHASAALFAGFARSAGVPLDNRQVLFDASHFPAGDAAAAAHQPEVLYRIGPLPRL